MPENDVAVKFRQTAEIVDGFLTLTGSVILVGTGGTVKLVGRYNQIEPAVLPRRVYMTSGTDSCLTMSMIEMTIGERNTSVCVLPFRMGDESGGRRHRTKVKCSFRLGAAQVHD